MRPIVDAHLDLGWNALSFNRDITQPLDSINEAELSLTDEPARGRATVSLPELRRGGVAVCFATCLARCRRDQPRKSLPKRTDLDFASPAIAHAAAQGQLACYRQLERDGHVRLLHTRSDLDGHWERWRSATAEQQRDLPVGLILSMEGTDPITHPDQAADWWRQGLRAAGLAHYGQGQHATGTGSDGPLTDAGRALLRELDRLGVALDVTHLSDTSMDEALDRFAGPVLASHHNCRALVPGDRQLPDDRIRRLLARGGVIGAALDAWMLTPGWQRGKTTAPLDSVVDHIEHVCDLAGDTSHAAIGSDLDGGFGSDQTPQELETIADLQRLADLLTARGFTDDDVDAIFHGNWLRLLRSILPEDVG